MVDTLRLVFILIFIVIRFGKKTVAPKHHFMNFTHFKQTKELQKAPMHIDINKIQVLESVNTDKGKRN